MQAKKKILNKILKKLIWHRSLSEWFLVLLNSEYCDEQTVNELSRMIYNASKDMKKSKEQAILQKWLSLINQIHQQEITEREQEENELNDMLNSL